MMNELRPGEIVTLSVYRTTPLGYILTNEAAEEVFLHRNEATRELAEDEEVDVFLYIDQKSRLTATMAMPKIQEGTYEWLEVVDVKRRMGAFVNIGTNKDLLIAASDLPLYEDSWPKVGDRLYCSMRITHRGMMYGRLATDDIMKDRMTPAPRELFNRDLEGIVYRLLKVGTYIVTDEGYVGFVHETERKEEPRLGERVKARVINVKDDGTLNLSLLGRKQESMGGDAEQLYEYMESRGGAMPFWDKSYPEDIRERFNMSKAAFKRALGQLMKEDKVYQEEGWTYFKGK